MKITVYIAKDGHHVDVLMTKKRILQIKYHAHPELNTHALGCAYSLEDPEEPCVCVDLADSLSRGLYTQVLVVLEGHVFRMSDRKTLTTDNRTERLDLVRDWSNMNAQKRRDRLYG